ncbi:hypothetical protein RFI_12454 [Reticulomyxa filosa]|uniref:Uncharacterized protein n=1 Tax=Reticulomyxa filosa TaxID=46433 RepID=X6NFM8_RETFI|nr:hypothetical protein RFI_12454 [Reticulomyxa filosa]|eukprot:ETO24703.1 hypothetical protein RFI_12454 [Reticulomyxa filosa]
MSSFKVYVNDGTKMRTVMPSDVTSEQKRIDCSVEVNESEIKKQGLQSYSMKHPLILLAGAIEYEQQRQHLENVRHELYIFEALFQSKFGYEVCSTYNSQNASTESLTLHQLNNFILQHGLDNEKNKVNGYDGLIFVWCGYGTNEINENILITSDGKIKHLKDIQNDFVKKTDYFIGKPKIFIKIGHKGEEIFHLNRINSDNETIRNKPSNIIESDIFAIFVTTSTYCSKKYNQDIEKATIQIVFDKTVGRELIQTASTLPFALHLVPRSFLKEQIQNTNTYDVKYEPLKRDKNHIPETLDFKNHWNRLWRKANAEAVKIVKAMLSEHEQGLIVVAYNTLKWKNRNDNLSSLLNLVNNIEDDIKDFEDYLVCVIKRKAILLQDINIDGNAYAIDCELQCKGYTKITTQLFVTANARIDQQLRQSLSIIKWNMEIHHDVPLQLRAIEYEEEKCTEDRYLSKSINHLERHLQFSIDTLGADHLFVAISYNMLGLRYYNKRDYDSAIHAFEKALRVIIGSYGVNFPFGAQLYYNLACSCSQKDYQDAKEYFELSLKIRLNTHDINHADVAWSYYSLGTNYKNNKQHDKAIECYKNALNIRKSIFGYSDQIVGTSCWDLGMAFEYKNQNDIALIYYEEAYKTYSATFGEPHEETMRAKRKVKRLSDDVYLSNH